jgi:acetyl esterase/lipase
MDQVMAQKEAVRYVEEIAAVTKKPLILCGHSKGGNLAMYADMYTSEETRERIPQIRVYDSPGFRREIAEGSRMAETAPKTLRYLPDTSLVGLLMFDPTPYTVVSSKVAAGSSHNPFNWQILGEKLVREEKLTALSEYLDEVLDQWLDSVPDPDRLRFIDTLFNAVDASGVQFADLEKTPLKAYPQIISQLASLSDEMKDQVLGVAGKLAKAGKEVLFSNVADAIRAQAEKLKNS